jgi:hypothetical protein
MLFVACSVPHRLKAIIASLGFDMICGVFQAKQLCRFRRRNDKTTAAFFPIKLTTLQLINLQSVSKLLSTIFLQNISEASKDIQQGAKKNHLLTIHAREVVVATLLDGKW